MREERVSARERERERERERRERFHPRNRSHLSERERERERKGENAVCSCQNIAVTCERACVCVERRENRESKRECVREKMCVYVRKDNDIYIYIYM